MTDKYCFETHSNTVPDDWDAFVEASAYGSVHQLGCWADFQALVPGRQTILALCAREKSTQRIVAATLCIKMETGIRGTFWWYSSRGPVFDPMKNKAAGLFLMHQAHDALKPTKALYWRVSSALNSDEYDQLELPEYALATRQYNPTDTLVIDLSQDEAALLAQMKRKGRYNISLARKKGVTTRRVSGEKAQKKDIQKFFALMQETTKRDKFGGHPMEYYTNLCAHLGLRAQVFFAEFEGETIATAITTLEGGRCIYYFGASTSDKAYRNLMAPYLLQWEMMLWAKANDAKTYDFLGISPEGVEDHEYAGITAFKKKFGGMRKTYAPAVEMVFRPVAYEAYKLARKIRKIFKR
jgi:peptidoglycan pentaglycine glycine transferase (the first glycine)